MLVGSTVSEPEFDQCSAPFAISTLRGQFADNREWSADPSRAAVIIGTVDMIDSRLLFSGYGIGFKSKPLHAGFLGQDVLIVHDEAHLEPAFQKLLIAIEDQQHEAEQTGELPWRKMRVMELSATSRGSEKPFELTSEEKTPPESLPEKFSEPIHFAWQRLMSKKAIAFEQPESDKETVADRIGKAAKRYSESNPGSRRSRLCHFARRSRCRLQSPSRGTIPGSDRHTSRVGTGPNGRTEKQSRLPHLCSFPQEAQAERRRQ